MRRAGFIGALLLLVAVNVAVLGGVAWNRAGQPEASLLLTERELPLSYSLFSVEENSGLALQLTLYQDGSSPDWLDEQKLRTLGFHPQRHDTSDAAAGARDKQALPRRAWVVLEFDGPAWQAVLAESERQLAGLGAKIASGESTVQQQEYRQQSLEQLRQGASRLIAVDAGTDAVALRDRYSNTTRYLITGAEIHMWIERVQAPQENSDHQRVTGSLRLLAEQIHVSLHQRAALQSALGGDVQARGPRAADNSRLPRYAVVLNVGARFEPWIAAIRSLDAAAPP
ncbi:MAG: DUF4824 family protein [Gammaproteobacteria bacterium]